MFCYIHRSVPNPVVTREVSSGSCSEWMQRPTAKQEVEREPKLEVSIWSLLLVLGEPCQRGGGAAALGPKGVKDMLSTWLAESTDGSSQRLKQHLRNLMGLCWVLCINVMVVACVLGAFLTGRLGVSLPLLPALGTPFNFLG